MWLQRAQPRTNGVIAHFYLGNLRRFYGYVCSVTVETIDSNARSETVKELWDQHQLHLQATLPLQQWSLSITRCYSNPAISLLRITIRLNRLKVEYTFSGGMQRTPKSARSLLSKLAYKTSDWSIEISFCLLSSHFRLHTSTRNWVFKSTLTIQITSLKPILSNLMTTKKLVQLQSLKRFYTLKNSQICLRTGNLEPSINQNFLVLLKSPAQGGFRHQYEFVHLIVRSHFNLNPQKR